MTSAPPSMPPVQVPTPTPPSMPPVQVPASTIAQLDVKLSGPNYREWSVSIQLLFDALDLTGHIDGAGPPTDDSKLKDWLVADRRARGIISTSVNIDIRMQLINLSTAHQMWSLLRQMYEQSSYAQSYAEFQEISMAHQGERSIQEFYSFMQARWRQLATMDEPLCRTCSACQCTVKQKQVRDQQRLFQFLMRLRPEFEALRGQLLHRTPFPTIDVALAELIAEETRLRVLSSSSSAMPNVLAAHGPASPPPVPAPTYHQPPSSYIPNPGTRKDKRSIQCRYCHLWGHSIQDCRKKKWADQHLRSSRNMPTVASAPSVPPVNNASSTEQQPSTIQLSLPQLLQMFQQHQLTPSTSSGQSPSIFSSTPSGFGMTGPGGSSDRDFDWTGS
ncbi:uncharacterized protein LOC109720129 [Ananas comosus]|uniref:Uncharacterized protein LOC109720129 n=1 Tax=Ananas comosus TaxID=4615 RepID=A0A6P5G1X9_ANACO|nr:uncharacterized protein LOC109720129 [Ananas comosus]